MPLTRVIGLAAVFAVAAMAFVGTSSALAQTHEVVWCKALVTLCPNGKLWPTGTELLFLAPKQGGPESTLLGTLNVKCPDSLITAVTQNTIGVTVSAQITSVEVGKLPTPSLGAGCTSCTAVHVSVPISGQLVVEAIDKYFLTATAGKMTLKNCLGLGIECVFEGKNIKVPVLHTGEHGKHPGANLLVAHIKEVVLPRVGGSPFCGSEAKWDAEYVLTLAHFGIEKGLAWPSLDKK